MTETYDFSAGRRGAVVNPAPDTASITLRLDDEVIEWFREQVNRAGGGDYQALINAALHDHIHRHEGQTLEETLRRILREEKATQA